jgi:CheY-like chemotaxis protein
MALILVAEDNEDVRFALVTILEEAGHCVVEADAGIKVGPLVAAEHPDVVLLDVVMPGFDGFDALKLLKSDEATRDVPVIMVTAKSRQDDVREARRLGAGDYISKPWESGEVEERVERALQRQPRV